MPAIAYPIVKSCREDNDAGGGDGGGMPSKRTGTKRGPSRGGDTHCRRVASATEISITRQTVVGSRYKPL